MKISFIGDVMLSRYVANQFKQLNYRAVDDRIIEKLLLSDCVIANLESPVVENATSDGDHLSFMGDPKLLDQFSFVDCFSLANNHINDCAIEGIEETINSLKERDINWNGLFKDKYEPFVIKKDGIKCVVFTCTDMMNHPFLEDYPWKVFFIDDKQLDQIIIEYKKKGYFVFLYAHVGMLFTRFPNPVIRKLLHHKIDIGVDSVVTVHSHVLGGMERYKGKPIFHSIGDFVMDGNSYRRRRAVVLNISINDDHSVAWEIIPTQIDEKYKTVLPGSQTKQKMLKSWEFVSQKIEKNSKNYTKFFKKQYKKEMLQHTLSTLKFLWDTKGFIGLVSLLVKRFEEVKRMKDWIIKDRSEMRMDSDAISSDRKRFSQKDLFNID